jgi:hypothetical protein
MIAIDHHQVILLSFWCAIGIVFIFGPTSTTPEQWSEVAIVASHSDDLKQKS